MTLPGITGKEAEQALLKAGWYLHHSKGAHFYYKHPDFIERRVTIPMHTGEVLAAKHLDNILKLADLSIDVFSELL